jgi:hypothetical protein
MRSVSFFRLHRLAARLRKRSAISSVTLAIVSMMSGQQPSKEYIRIGDRVIAIENPVLFSVNVTPTSVTVGMADTLSFNAGTTPTCTSNCNPTWQVVSLPGDTGAASINASGVLTPSAVGTIHVQATIGTASGTAAVTILPVFNPSPNPSFPASGGTGQIAITKQGAWTVQVSPSAAWFQFTNPAPAGDGSVSGTGNATINYTITPNTTTSPLSTNLTLGSFSLPVNEAASVGSAPTVSSVPTLSGTAGTFTLAVTYNGIAWSINESSLASWIHLDQNSTNFVNSQSTNGTVTFDYDANSISNPHAATTICVAYASSCVNVSISQASGIGLSPQSQPSAAAAGANYTINVTAPAGTPWSATVPSPADAQWLILANPASGTGNGSFIYEVIPNPGSGVRQGTIDVSGTNFIVTQLGTVSVVQISPGGQFLSQQSNVTFNATLGGAPVSVVWALSGSTCGESLSNTSSVLSTTGTSVTFYAPLNCASEVRDTLTANSSASVTIIIAYPTGAGGVQGVFSGGTQPYPYLSSEVIFPGYTGSTSSSYYNAQFSITGNSASGSGVLPSLQNSCAMQTNLVNAYQSIASTLFLENDAGSGVVSSPSPPGVGLIPQSAFTGNALTTVPFNSQCEIDPAHGATNFTTGLQVPLDVFFGVRLRPAFAANNSSYSIWVSVDDGMGHFPVNPIQIGTWSSPSYQPPTLSWSSTAQPAGTAVGTIPLIGWAFDNATNPEGPIASVQIQVDGATVQTITTLGAPPSDGTTACPTNLPPLQPAGLPVNSLWNCGNTSNANYNNIGWSYSWDTTTVSNGSHTVTVIATDSDPTPHISVISRTFSVANPTALSPIISLPGGTYPGTQNVTLSLPSGQTGFIYYTLNGNTPTASTGILYQSAVQITQSEPLKAIVHAAGFVDSPVVSALYTITAPPPSVLNLPAILLGGTYQATNTVTNCTGAVSAANCTAVTLSSSANVTLLGGTQIILGPGFTAIAPNTSTSLVMRIGNQ